VNSVVHAFTVLGLPQAWQRARVSADGKHFTPPKTRRYERLVATVAGLQRPPAWRLDGTYRVEVHAYFPDARPRDVDNVAKAVLDGLNRVLWNDDRQVVRIVSEKHVDRARPRIEVTVELVAPAELGAPPAKTVRAPRLYARGKREERRLLELARVDGRLR
jgi:Holliday junction resolvase RusA-like endonuclease